jgi:aminobenzoyl-glutamate utilization protein B
LTWHPGYANAVSRAGHTAMNSFKVNFHGIAAHAAGSPEMGRSALDGVQLMDVGVNYLREHILQDARIHCVITDGGRAPNIVPAFAQVWYYVRSLTRKQVEDIYARVLDIAKGAALMSGTTYDVDFITGCYEVLPNETLGNVLQEKLRVAGPPQYTKEEKDFARQLQATTPPDAVERSLHRLGVTVEQVGDPLSETIVELTGLSESRGSTDVGDVSHVTPTAQITACCQALGTPGHSWQFAASSGSSIGHKGMMVAARTLALAALELETRPELLQEARAEFVRQTGGKPYVCAVPEGVGPR